VAECIEKCCSSYVGQFTHSRGNEYASNSRVTSIAIQQCCKHAFPTIERLYFLCDPCKVVIKKSSVEAVEELSFENPACWDMSLGAEELN
jgi:hypothetical protein